MSRARPPLELEGVSFGYDPKRTVLNGVNLSVHPGELVGLHGPNGGGKTTLVRLLLGQHRPQAGRIHLCGAAPAPGRHPWRMGYIGHPSRNDGEAGLPADLRVSQLLEAYHGLFRATGLPLPHAATLLPLLGLDRPDLRGRFGWQLSDGERQRVLAYLALAKGPDLLVADEATCNLDPSVRRLLLNVVRDLSRTTPLAVLWITHRADELYHLKALAYQLTDGCLAPPAAGDWQVRLEVDGRATADGPLPAEEVLPALLGCLIEGTAREVRCQASRSTTEAHAGRNGEGAAPSPVCSPSRNGTAEPASGGSAPALTPAWACPPVQATGEPLVGILLFLFSCMKFAQAEQQGDVPVVDLGMPGVKAEVKTEKQQDNRQMGGLMLACSAVALVLGALGFAWSIWGGSSLPRNT